MTSRVRCPSFARTSSALLLAAASLAGSGCGPTNDADSATASTNMTGAPSSTSATGETTGEGSTAGETDTTGDATGVPTTGMGSGSSTTEELTSAGTSTGPATTGPDTTGETFGSTSGGTTGGGDELEVSCEAACATLLGCELDGFDDLPSCLQECIGAGDRGSPACLSALAEFNHCMSGLECAQLEAALNTNDFARCNPAFEAYAGACF